MKKKALVLIEGNTTGTGRLYVAAAQRLGFWPITLAADPGAYDYLAAAGSEAHAVDTADLSRLVEFCGHLSSEFKIAGITGAREAVYATVGRLCRRFSLPGPEPLSIERCCDKLAQRRCLAASGIPVPSFHSAACAEEAGRLAAAVGLPLVLKPAVGNGSAGVRLCRNPEEIATHCAHLFGGGHTWRSAPSVLLEEHVEGAWYSIETMGREVVGIAHADFGPPPHFVFRHFTFPAQLTEAAHRQIAELCLDCLAALGLAWGPANIEIRWGRRGPVVIEVNPRLAGTPDPQLVHHAFGIDLIAEHVKLVTGGEPDLSRRRNGTAAARFLVPDRQGKLEWIGGQHRAAAVPDIVEVAIKAWPGMTIRHHGDYRDAIGHIIAASPHHDRTDGALRRAIDLIGWKIQSSPISTMDSCRREP